MKKKNLELAKKIIDLMRKEHGEVAFESPYEVENFAADYLSNHSFLFETGKFKKYQE